MNFMSKPNSPFFQKPLSNSSLPIKVKPSDVVELGKVRVIADTGVCGFCPQRHSCDFFEKKLSLVNGVLFTGGWAKSGLCCDIVGTVFKDNDVLEQFSAADQASTLQFMRNINLEVTVFQRFPPDLLKKLSTDCLVMQNHHYGISPERFRENANLRNFFQILTTSADENEKVYISTVKANQYPVTAFRWHPEVSFFTCVKMHLNGAYQ